MRAQDGDKYCANPVQRDVQGEYAQQRSSKKYLPWAPSGQQD